MALDDIKPVSFIKQNMADTLTRINETRRPIVITQNGEAKGVLQDPESFDATRKSVAMLKLLLQRQADFSLGETLTQDQVFSRIDKLLTRSRRKK